MPDARRASRGAAASGGLLAPLIVGLVLLGPVLADAAAVAEERAPEPPPGGVARVVSLVPSVTETVFALGRGDRLVGISTFCDYPPEAVRSIPRAGSYLTPSVETIVALRPDVVLGVPTPGNQAAVEQLRDLGVPVVIVGEQTLEDTWRALRTIGRWVGNDDGADALVARIQETLDQVRARAARERPRKVLFVVGHDPLVVAGRGLFIDELIGVAGGINVGAASAGTWPRLSLETVVAAAPDVIIDGAMGSEAGANLAAYWRPYASVPAVREGRLRAQTSEALLRPGPRIGVAAQELFALIHSDGEPDGAPDGAPRPSSRPAPPGPQA
ncbi:MAG: helical backbone metal receptor [Thermodesulfobacteriota bacterium]